MKKFLLVCGAALLASCAALGAFEESAESRIEEYEGDRAALLELLEEGEIDHDSYQEMADDLEDEALEDIGRSAEEARENAKIEAKEKTSYWLQMGLALLLGGGIVGGRQVVKKPKKRRSNTAA